MLITLFVVSVLGALSMAVYGLGVLVGRWERPQSRGHHVAHRRTLPMPPVPPGPAPMTASPPGPFATPAPWAPAPPMASWAPPMAPPAAMAWVAPPPTVPASMMPPPIPASPVAPTVRLAVPVPGPLALPPPPLVPAQRVAPMPPPFAPPHRPSPMPKSTMPPLPARFQPAAPGTLETQAPMRLARGSIPPEVIVEDDDREDSTPVETKRDPDVQQGARYSVIRSTRR